MFESNFILHPKNKETNIYSRNLKYKLHHLGIFHAIYFYALFLRCKTEFRVGLFYILKIKYKIEDAFTNL